MPLTGEFCGILRTTRPVDLLDRDHAACVVRQDPRAHHAAHSPIAQAEHFGRLFLRYLRWSGMLGGVALQGGHNDFFGGLVG